MPPPPPRKELWTIAHVHKEQSAESVERNCDTPPPPWALPVPFFPPLRAGQEVGWEFRCSILCQPVTSNTQGGRCMHRARTMHLLGYCLFPRSTMPKSELPGLVPGLAVYPPLVVPHPLSFPGGWGTVTWSTQNFSLRLIVLLCGWLCCGALPLVSLALMAGHFAHFR